MSARRRRATIAVGAVLAAAALVAPAAGPAGLEGYVGGKFCNACHKSTNADIVAAQAKTSHVFALWAVAEQGGERKVVGDFATAPAFKQSDVAWVLGRGLRQQAYIGSDFKALPGEWTVSHKEWQATASADARKECIACHTSGYDVTAGEWKDEGVTCEACHGPGANHAKSSTEQKKATAFNPKSQPPDRRAMICGRCHSRGKNPDGLPFAVGFKPGDDLTKVFTLDTTWEQGARQSQYNDLVAGKHLAAGVDCDTCHDPHGVVTGTSHQLRKPADELCLGCHSADKLTPAQHTPPADCVRCHMPAGSHQFEKPKSVPPGTAHWH